LHALYLVFWLRERLKQISKMRGRGALDLSDDEEGGAEAEAAAVEQAASGKKARKGGKRARADKIKLSEDFLDEDWDPEKHEVSVAVLRLC
jgi:hypothetical protein